MIFHYFNIIKLYRKVCDQFVYLCCYQNLTNGIKWILYCIVLVILTLFEIRDVFHIICDIQYMYSYICAYLFITNTFNWSKFIRNVSNIPCTQFV